MAEKSCRVTIRMDAEIKAEADELFAELGLDFSTAVNVFVRQALRQGKIPFEVALNHPNEETIAAMREAEGLPYDPSAKRYSDVEEALRELKG